MKRPDQSILLLFIILLFLESCTRNNSKQHVKHLTMPKEKVFFDKNNRLNYFGKLSKESNNKLFQLYNNSETKPQTLVVSSTGGDVFLGLDIGDWMVTGLIIQLQTWKNLVYPMFIV